MTTVMIGGKKVKKEDIEKMGPVRIKALDRILAERSYRTAEEEKKGA